MIEKDSSRTQMQPGREPSASEFSDTFETRPIGEYLRRQRELRGMTAEELASMTRIPLRSLERLESGQFDGETDGFVRGFVRTVAIALGMDADDAIARMLLEPTPTAWEEGSTSRSVKQGLIGVILLLLLVASFFVLRAGWSVLLGEASTPNSREVVLWHDPVRALAEATGVRLDPADEIDPRGRAPIERSRSRSPSARAESTAGRDPRDR